MSARKHDWHLMDTVRGLEVRQATNRWRRNRWEVRDEAGRVAELDDNRFDLLRSGVWLPRELR